MENPPSPHADSTPNAPQPESKAPPTRLDPFVYSLKEENEPAAEVAPPAAAGSSPKAAARAEESAGAKKTAPTEETSREEKKSRKEKKPAGPKIGGPKPGEPKPAPKPPRRGFFFQLGVIIGVAFVLATLFTAWTPGSYGPSLPTPQGPSSVSGEPTLPPTPSFLGALGLATPTSPTFRLVGLVAGHWKNENDPGAVCDEGLNHTREVDVNLNIATMVQSLITAQGYQVQMLAEFDPRLNGFKGAALLSIHSDSCQFINSDATGFKVASALANTNPERSARLTACLRARYGKDTGLRLHSTSVTIDMTSYHAFDEIDPSTPAAIIETGFLNLDYKLLTQTPEIAAQGISDGLLCFLRNESITPATPVSPATTSSTANAPAVKTPAIPTAKP